MQNKDLAKIMFQSIIKNFELLMDKAWIVTQQYCDLNVVQADPSLSPE